MKKSIKKKYNSRFGTLGVIIAVLIIVIGVYVVLNKSIYQIPQNDTQNQTKTFESKLLKLSIVVPSGFVVKDEGVRLLASNQYGIIIISRNGTQFSSLDDYVKDFDIKHKNQASNENNLLIDGYSSLSRVIKYPGSSPSGDRIYFVYVDNAVYHFSTSLQSLFTDLDQIAQSFRYAP